MSGLRYEETLEELLEDSFEPEEELADLGIVNEIRGLVNDYNTRRRRDQSTFVPRHWEIYNFGLRQSAVLEEGKRVLHG